MTVVLGPTWDYEQCDKLVTLSGMGMTSKALVEDLNALTGW